MGPGWLVAALLLHVGARCLARWDYSLPYTPQTDKCKDQHSEYLDKNINKCCSNCPPGSHMLHSCNSSTDTKCESCPNNMYTAIWNKARRCLGCASPCGAGLVQTQECTRTQDRICSCSANSYCPTKRSQGRCLFCRAHKTCAKGYGVSKPGTDSTNTECSPCPPGTFSDVESSTALCKPHRVCQLVSVQGNATGDTICMDLEVYVPVIVTSPPATTPSTSQLPAQSFTSTIQEIRTNPVGSPFSSVSETIGIIAGLTFLVLIVLAVVVCFILSRRKAADLKQPDKKQRDIGAQISGGPQQEQQLLLETPGSSSSSLDNAAARINGISVMNTEKKETEKTQQRCIISEGCSHHSGARPNSASSEHSANGGTQVNVTCIVNVCNSNHNPQFPEQMTSTTTDYENVPCCTPTEEEIPLSKEENPLKRESEIQISVEAADSLPPNLLFSEGKLFPLSVQDVGMKTS